VKKGDAMNGSSKIDNRKVSELIEYATNPREIGTDAVDKLAAIISQFGFRVPIIAKSDGVIVDGHLRLLAAKKLGLDEVPCLSADDMSEAQIRGFRIAVNKAAELASWDDDLLSNELKSLSSDGFNLDSIGFDDGEMDSIIADFEGEDSVPNWEKREGRCMRDEFLQPPFSIMDTRGNEWITRRRELRELIGDDGESREGTLFGNNAMRLKAGGASILDPVLSELVIAWFGKTDGVAFDPFAGDTVFGYMAGYKGMGFFGIELREQQALLNQKRCSDAGLPCKYYCDSSENMDKYIKDDSVDLVFSCPPYADLEVYSDDPRDLSTMAHDDFFSMYEKILKNTFQKLKENRFAVIVIGEVRNKKTGAYLGTVPETIRIMTEAGYEYYNEIILVNSQGNLPMRAARPMRATRKIGKMHQNILVFLKGDGRKAAEELGVIDVGFGTDEEGSTDTDAVDGDEYDE